MIALLLIIVFGIPACATVTGLIVWVLHRNVVLEDAELQRNFLIVFAMCFGLGWAVLRTDTVRMKVDPGFRIKTEIEANELYRTINRIDESGTGLNLRLALQQQMIAGASLKDALLSARPLLSEAARYRLAFADQQTRIQWARYVTDTLKELQQENPESCYLMVSGGTVDVSGGALSQENADAFDAALISLFESSDMTMRRERSPTDVPATQDEGRREFAAIKEELNGQYGSAVATAITSRAFENPPAPAEKMCRARIFQMEAILSRPQGVSAMLVGDALR